MSFLNPVLLYGLLLVGVPILLHFLMRQKPKRLLFPALRLIEVRRRNNVRRLRLRHIWLLLLRVAVIGLLAFAIARPSLPAANYTPNVREWLTMAAVLLVAGVVYYAVLRVWQRRNWPNHVYSYRRSVLRGAAAGAGFLLFLLLCVWPYQRRIAAEVAAPLPEVAENLPVAAVFLFDTSLSMQYRQQNKTHLDRAREIATQHLSNLPPGSRVSIADTSNQNPVLFQADLASAQARIEALEIHPVGVPLNDRLRTALRLQKEDIARTRQITASDAEETGEDHFLREIYVFTDLARSAWRTSAAEALERELSEAEWLHVYLIDVGSSAPQNIAVTELRLSRQTVSAGGELVLQAVVTAVGASDAKRTVELRTQTASGELVKQGQSEVTLTEESGEQVTFLLQGLSAPQVRGEVRVLSSDPLESDDVRYFTAEVEPPPEVLLVSDSRSETLFLQEALAPTELVRRGKARYQCVYLASRRLEEAVLDRYAVICLINVARPTDGAWEKLSAYVDRGGGLAVFLGMPNEADRPPPVAYNSPEARAILPAELLAELTFRPPQVVDLGQLHHPIFQKFEQFGGAALLTSAEIRRHWRVRPVEGANVIAHFTDRRRSPALLERAHGSGRSLMLATAVDLKTRGQSWNDLPLAQWQFVALADQMMQYLTGQADDVFNYNAGDAVLARVPAVPTPAQYLLRKPRLQQLPLEVPPDRSIVSIEDADQIGHYEIVGADENSEFRAGFSVNPPAAESDFTRMNPDELDRFLGAGRYRVAPSIEELERIVTHGRIGQEVFPLVLSLMVLAFCAEHFVANRFYETGQS